MTIPSNLPDCRTPGDIVENHKLANEFAERGTVKHFMLRQGFMPHDEKQAEGILVRIIREREWLESYIESLENPSPIPTIEVSP